MDYINWAKEYEESISKIDVLIERLCEARKGKCKAKDGEIRNKIKYYRAIRRELVETRHHLLTRAKP